MKKSLPVVVIGQNYCTSLGIIKALGEAGFRVEVGRRTIGRSRFSTPDMRSKYVNKSVFLCTGTDRDMICSLTESFASPHDRKVLIPSDDFCTALVDRNYDELSRSFILPNAKNKQGAVSRLMDKSIQNELARKSGIKVAESLIITVSSEGNFVIPENTPYPCLIKPIASVGHPKSCIQKCENREDLIRKILKVARKQDCSMLVEQFIDIEKEYTIPGIAIGDDVIIPAVIEKLRTGEGDHKGVTVSGRVRNSNIIGDIVGRLKSFVSETGYQGIFDIEILQSKNELFFNEINMRNGAAGYSLTKSGVNLPAMYAGYMMKLPAFHVTERLTSERTFVNEKAALDNYLGGFCSLRTLIKTIRSADIRFLLDACDIKSCLSFTVLSLCLTVRRFLGFR